MTTKQNITDAQVKAAAIVIAYRMDCAPSKWPNYTELARNVIAAALDAK